MSTPILEIDNVSVSYVTQRGLATAVKDVNLTVNEDEIVGLVGESGCGKSTLANAVMRLLGEDAYVTEGSIRVLGKDVYRMRNEELRRFRWTGMSMVFQSAMNALNPVKTVESQIIDTLLAHRPGMARSEAHNRAVELFRLVRIDPKRLSSFPHELSGGMRQRVVIAIAIALEPKLVIMDEPTTALDVVVQKSILDQVIELKERVGFSVLFISHDFNLVAEISNRVGVMYAGRLIELTQSSRGLTTGLHHPYTQGLIRAIPKLRREEFDDVVGIPGTPPGLFAMPSGCPFHPRCPAAKAVCKTDFPPVLEHEDGSISCHLTPDELRGLSYART